MTVQNRDSDQYAFRVDDSDVVCEAEVSGGRTNYFSRTHGDFDSSLAFDLAFFNFEAFGGVDVHEVVVDGDVDMVDCFQSCWTTDLTCETLGYCTGHSADACGMKNLPHMAT